MRPISNTILDAFLGGSIELSVAVEMFFDGGTVRIWSGVGDRTIGGNTYTGTGALLNVDRIEESDDLSARGVQINLSGIDSAIVAIALAEPYQNRECKVHLGANGNFFELFSGFMDTMLINDSGQSCEISVAVESRLITLERVVPLRYTQETHAAKYPTDTFFSYVSDLSEKVVVWGRKT